MGMSAGRKGAMAEINVTPLVDVMLVLLIIFMVTAPMMDASVGVEVDLPTSEAPPLEPDQDQLILSIAADHTIYIGDFAYTPEELPAKLAAIAEANPDQPAFLRADGAVPYADIAALLGIAKKAGIVRVGLVFEPGVGELGGGG
ncbi:MAG: biopolymer transporter ExbD [Alphaproteobacteria bacterium]|nr:biopolymer transporter ExbD [Alphaproteobacteria bacterium]